MAASIKGSTSLAIRTCFSLGVLAIEDLDNVAKCNIVNTHEGETPLMSSTLRPREIKFVVQSKPGVGGRYKAAKDIYDKTNSFISERFPDAVKIERKLNNGLLSHEAEAAYARAGFHNKEIFRVQLTAAGSNSWHY